MVTDLQSASFANRSATACIAAKSDDLKDAPLTFISQHTRHATQLKKRMRYVDSTGFEPVTNGLQSRRSTN